MWKNSLKLLLVHAQGEIGKVIVGGAPESRAPASWKKMNHINTVDNCFRRFVTFEPRAHVAMSANLLLAPTQADADAGFIVLQADKAHPMSGSNCICVVTALLESGRVPMVEPETVLRLDTAAGLIVVRARCANGRCLSVSLDNVPAFALEIDRPVETPRWGRIRADIAFGGVFYALLDVQEVGLTIVPENARALAEAGMEIKTLLKQQARVSPPRDRGPRRDRLCDVPRPRPRWRGEDLHHAEARPRGPEPLRHRLLRQSRGASCQGRGEDGRQPHLPLHHRRPLHGGGRGRGGRRQLQGRAAADHRRRLGLWPRATADRPARSLRKRLRALGQLGPAGGGTRLGDHDGQVRRQGGAGDGRWWRHWFCHQQTTRLGRRPCGGDGCQRPKCRSRCGRIRSAGHAASAIAADIGKGDQCLSLVKQVLAARGQIDVLVNNAGINRRGNIMAISEDDWQATFAVNLDAMFHLCRAVIPQMMARGGGAIVNTASQWGLHPAPNHIAYNVSKAAVASFTQNLGRDYAPHRICVNAVCPGEIHTPMLEAGVRRSGRTIADLDKMVPYGPRQAGRGRGTGGLSRQRGSALHVRLAGGDHGRAGGSLTQASLPTGQDPRTS